MLSNIISSCNYLLNNYPEAEYIREYLDNRINKESQELFQFGYFPNFNNIKSLANMVGESILIDSKLIYEKHINDSTSSRTVYASYFENYPLLMPFKDPYGNVVAIVGRTLLSDSKRKELGISKYKNTVFSKGHYIFGLFENKTNILNKDKVFVVEGQFDAIKATECGINNVVALGSSSMTDYQFAIILRYTNNIVLLLDNDEAGNKGRSRIMSKFGKLANITNLFIPEPFKDVDDYLTNSEDINIF